MNTKPKSLSHHAMMYGLYLGLALVVFTLITYVGNLMTNKSLGYISYLIIIVGLFMSLKHYRDKVQQGILAFATGLKLGVLVSVFAGLISGVFTSILYMMDPSLIDQIIQVSQQAMLEQGISEDQVVAMEETMRSVTNPIFLSISSVLGFALIGTLISLIAAAILKKNPTNPFDAVV